MLRVIGKKCPRPGERDYSPKFVRKQSVKLSMVFSRFDLATSDDAFSCSRHLWIVQISGGCGGGIGKVKKRNVPRGQKRIKMGVGNHYHE